MVSYFCLSGYGTNPANNYQAAVLDYIKSINGTLVKNVELFKESIILEIKQIHTDYRRCAELRPSWFNSANGEDDSPVWCLSMSGSNFRVECTLYPVRRAKA